MGIAISSIGLATAQGSTVELSNGNRLRAPECWPWPVNGWTTSHFCRPALGVSPALGGIARWLALVQSALKDCLGDLTPSARTPMILATCNGSADGFDTESWSEAFNSAALLEGTAWSSQRSPVFSSSCNSGLHALYAAKQLLMAGLADEVVVVAADILSRSNQNNFEVLRVLTNSPMVPWQPTSRGFVLGEAAVAIRLARANGIDGHLRLAGPVLGNELTQNDGLPRVLKQFSGSAPELVLGQGTGPFESDEAELSAFRNCIDRDVPLATPLAHFGHTLGASGLLSVALAALIPRNAHALSALSMPGEYATDGRPLLNHVANNSAHNSLFNEKGIDNILVSCRALNGSCAAVTVGTTEKNDARSEKIWHSPALPGPLMHPTLRRLAADAFEHRPPEPPDVLVVQLEAPFAPPPGAMIGGRLLPSSVLEITPGFVSQLIARCWGFSGPVLCLVGKTDTGQTPTDFQEACKINGLVVGRIDVQGRGDEREIAWSI